MAEQHVVEHHHPALAHHFNDLGQQRAAAELGMWVFLATEVMFFGGMFMAYLAYRYWYPDDFAAGSHHMDLVLGTINTGVLLCSSLTMALAVHAAQNAQRRALVGLLLATVVLGGVFLVVKGFEYHHKYEEHHMPILNLPFEFDAPDQVGLRAFFNIYFLMTGFHALHMVIGMVILLVLAWWAWRGGLLAERSVVVHNTGLYWHFVDLVWVYLFPFFYLVAARGH